MAVSGPSSARRARTIAVVAALAVAAVLVGAAWSRLDNETELLGIAALVAATASLPAAGYLLLARVAWRTRIARLAASGLSLALCTLALELPVLVAGLDYRVVLGIPIQLPWRNPENLSDPVLLHIHKPNGRYAGRMLGGNIAQNYGVPAAGWYEWDVALDRSGFRNREPLEGVELAVIGDSFVEAPLIDDAALFTNELERRTGRRVANLGQSYYGPQQELEVLRRFALPLEPRVCVWCFFEGNDLDELVRYDATQPRWAAFSRNAHSPWQRSFSRNALLLLGVRLGGMHVDPKADSRSGVLRLADGSEQRLYFSYPVEPLPDEKLDALRRAGECLAEAQRLCAERGVELCVVFLPTKFRVLHGFCRFEPGSSYAEASPNDLPERLRAIVAGISSEIDFVDVTPDLRARSALGVPTYFPDDSHMNAAGHAVLADALTRWWQAR